MSLIRVLNSSRSSPGILAARIPALRTPRERSTSSGTRSRWPLRELRQRIVSGAETHFGPGAWTLGRGFVARGSDRFPLQDLFSRAGGLNVETTYRPPAAKPIAPGIPHAGYGYWVQVMAVEVDTLTGEIAVKAVENYLDTGKTINPIGVAGQCEGAFAQGLGYALHENSIYAGGVLREPKPLQLRHPFHQGHSGSPRDGSLRDARRQQSSRHPRHRGNRHHAGGGDARERGTRCHRRSLFPVSDPPRNGPRGNPCAAPNLSRSV